MTKNNPRKLIKDTLKQIQEHRSRNPGRKPGALGQDILDSIRDLREHLTPRQIMQELSLPSHQIYKALRPEHKKKSAPSQFVEVRQITPSNPVQEKKGRVIVELKTESGMIISIYG